MKKLGGFIALLAMFLTFFAGCDLLFGGINPFAKTITIKVGIATENDLLLSPVDVSGVPEGMNVSAMMRNETLGKKLATSIGMEDEEGCMVYKKDGITYDTEPALYSDQGVSEKISESHVLKENDVVYIKATPRQEQTITIRLGVFNENATVILGPVDITDIPAGKTLGQLMADAEHGERVKNIMMEKGVTEQGTYKKGDKTYIIEVDPEKVYSDVDRTPFNMNAVLKGGEIFYFGATEATTIKVGISTGDEVLLEPTDVIIPKGISVQAMMENEELALKLATSIGLEDEDGYMVYRKDGVTYDTEQNLYNSQDVEELFPDEHVFEDNELAYIKATLRP